MTRPGPPPASVATQLDPAPLVAIVGERFVRSATAADAVDGLQPALVAEPASANEISQVLAWADANGLRVAPRGGGTRMGWGNRPTGVDLILSTSRLNQLVEHADGDMTATVEAGMPLTALQTELAKAGQALMLDVPLANEATIGGLIAVNDSGALRLRYGGIRDLILGVTFVRADGVVAHGGGKVVKNVAGYDLPKLLTGSFGTLGVITQATFRLHPLPGATRTLVVRFEDVEGANELILRVLTSSLVPTGLALEASADGAPRVLIRLAGLESSVNAQADALAAAVDRTGGTVQELTGDESRTAWAESHGLRSARDRGVVLKLSVLPTEIGSTIAATRNRFAEIGASPRIVLHGHGLGFAQIESAPERSAEDVADVIESLRGDLAEHGGAAVVLEAPRATKERLDVFGPAGDALPLMRRVKVELDPNETLNPGRFLGGV